MTAPIARTPRGNDWTSDRLVAAAPSGRRLAIGQRWQSGPVVVISSLDMAKLPQSEEIGPQWHVSVSADGKRPKPHHVRRALRAFDMADAEEDNHHPGVARHFFMPVDPAARVTCECKEDETTIVEPDGYTWSQAAGHCGGCDLQRATGKTCSVHKQVVSP